MDDGWIVALEQRPPFLAHPDVLRDPTRRDVILMHERNEARDLWNPLEVQWPDPAVAGEARTRAEARERPGQALPIP
jgi:hypothetical protein